jgi:hypothetical protein
LSRLTNFLFDDPMRDENGTSLVGVFWSRELDP